jgi:dihydrofolate reductase
MRGQPAALRTLGRELDVNTAASWRDRTTGSLLCPDTVVAYLLKPDTISRSKEKPRSGGLFCVRAMTTPSLRPLALRPRCPLPLNQPMMRLDLPLCRGGRQVDRKYARAVRPLRYSINVTLDGCCDHRAISPDEETHRHATESLAQADALLLGRVTYEMMESAWRPPGQTEAMPDWMLPFGRTIDAAKKYVVSSTLDRVDWNAELVRGDVGEAVQKLKREPGKGLGVGGIKLPLALAELGLIDEYEFVVHPRLVGHGPTLFAGLSKRVDLRLVSRQEFASGAVAMRYEPRVT